MKCINNCQKCYNNTSCSQCNAGYFYTSATNQCLACTQPNCLTCSGGSVCTSCAMGTFLSNTTNNYTCEACPTGCEVCTGLATCISCIDGYYMLGGQCYPCSEECTSCVSNPYKCVGCVSGFYLDVYTLRCLPCPDFCPECADPTNCTKCSGGFYLSNS